MLVLLLAASMMASADPVADLIDHAQAKLSVADCGEGAQCIVTEDFRVSGDEESPGINAKDRAFADDGSYCGVVGDKQCLSRPRFRLHASLPGQGGIGPIEMNPILPRH